MEQEMRQSVARSIGELGHRSSTAIRMRDCSAMQLMMTPEKNRISRDDVFSKLLYIKKARAGPAKPRYRMEERAASKLKGRKFPAR